MHEMSVNVQNMVKSTQVQASSVSETSASIDQMVASIQRVADTAKVLLDISNRSREEVHSGIASRYHYCAEPQLPDAGHPLMCRIRQSAGRSRWPPARPISDMQDLFDSYWST